MLQLKLQFILIKSGGEGRTQQEPTWRVASLTWGWMSRYRWDLEGGSYIPGTQRGPMCPPCPGWLPWWSWWAWEGRAPSTRTRRSFTVCHHALGQRREHWRVPPCLVPSSALLWGQDRAPWDCSTFQRSSVELHDVVQLKTTNPRCFSHPVCKLNFKWSGEKWSPKSSPSYLPFHRTCQKSARFEKGFVDKWQVQHILSFWSMFHIW